jgi:hypothetical protein
MQKKLGFLGYQVKDQNGIVGPDTRTAIENYQRDIGAKITGQLTERQYLVLVGIAATPQAVVSNETANAAVQVQAAPVPAAPAATSLIFDAGSGIDRAYFAGDQNRLAQNTAARERLVQLFILKGNPALLDNPSKTLSFLPLVEISQANAYVMTRSGQPLIDKRDRLDVQWRGTNQFEQEDSRVAFLAANKQTILAMTEGLPTEFYDVRPMRVGTYDVATKALEIGISGAENGPWGWSGGQTSFDSPMPIRLPQTWTLEPAVARQVVEAAAIGYRRMNPNEQDFNANARAMTASLVIAIRQKIISIRPTEHGAALDLTVLEMVVFDAPDLKVVVGTLPLPAGASVGGAVPPISANGSVTFDAMYPRLWAVAANPAILDNVGFLTESFDLRRKQEAAAAVHQEMVLSFPRVVGSSLLRSRQPAQQSDIDAMRAWLQTHSQGLPKRVLVNGFMLNKSGTSANGMPVVDIRNRWQGGAAGVEGLAGRDRSWIDSARLATMAILPNSVGAEVVWSGDAVPTIAAFHPHPAWFGVELPFEPANEQAMLELEVLSGEMRADENGKSFVLFDVLPTALVYSRDGAPQRFELAAPVESPTTPGTPGVYDVVGVRLGMPLAEAESLVQTAVGAGFERLEWSVSDPVFSDAVAFRKSAINGERLESVVIFYDSTIPERPVIGIGRDVQLQGAESNEAAVAAILPKLEQKFGTAIPWAGGRSSYFYWAQNPVTQALIRAKMRYDDACSFSDFEQFAALDQGARFGTAQATKSCGEMMRATIGKGGVAQFLTNADNFEAIRARKTAKEMPKAVIGENIEF